MSLSRMTKIQLICRCIAEAKNMPPAEAAARRPGVVTEALPTPNRPHMAYVGPTVEYATELEFGSHNRPARPYLQPALREVEGDFQGYFTDAINESMGVPSLGAPSLGNGTFSASGGSDFVIDAIRSIGGFLQGLFRNLASPSGPSIE